MAITKQKNVIHYSAKDIDVVLVYSPEKNKVYFVTLKDVKK